MTGVRPDYEILQFFEYDHLPEHLQKVSEPFSKLAHEVALGNDMNLPRCAETSTALRKLLEAKDAAVRAKVQGWPAEQGMKGGNDSIPGDYGTGTRS